MCKDSLVRFNPLELIECGVYSSLFLSYLYLGTCDCGLFAIVFATAIVMGEKPEEMQFDQMKMRRHLWKCLENKKMEMFSVIEKEDQKRPDLSKKWKSTTSTGCLP